MESISIWTTLGLLCLYLYSLCVFVIGILLFAYDGAITCKFMGMMHVYVIINVVMIALATSGRYLSTILYKDMYTRDRLNDTTERNPDGNICSGLVSALALTNFIIGASVIAHPSDCTDTHWLLYVTVTWFTQVSSIGMFLIAGFLFFLYYFFEDNTEFHPQSPITTGITINNAINLHSQSSPLAVTNVV